MHQSNVQTKRVIYLIRMWPVGTSTGLPILTPYLKTRCNRERGCRAAFKIALAVEQTVVLKLRGVSPPDHRLRYLMHGCLLMRLVPYKADYPEHPTIMQARCGAAEASFDHLSAIGILARYPKYFLFAVLFRRDQAFPGHA